MTARRCRDDMIERSDSGERIDGDTGEGPNGECSGERPDGADGQERPDAAN
jgi:hypothetical protein